MMGFSTTRLSIGATSQMLHHHINEALQLRRLSPIRVEQQVNGTWRRFIVWQHSDEPPGREVRAHRLFPDERQAETCERRLQQRSGAVDLETAVDQGL